MRTNQIIGWSRLKRSVAKRVAFPKCRSDPFQGSCFCAGEGRSKGKVLYCFGEVQAFSSVKNNELFSNRGLLKACFMIFGSVRSSYSHPDLLLTHQHHPLFQITPVLNTGLSLSEPRQLYKGNNAI